jgi:hypothetical protein
LDQLEETPTLPARYYRQKAAEARRAAEGVTTRAIKARLDVLARDFDRLAEAADSAAQTGPARWGDPKVTMKRDTQNELAEGVSGNPRERTPRPAAGGPASLAPR